MCGCVPNDGGANVWVPTASRNSASARRNEGTTPLQGKGGRAATTAVTPAKRPARLDGRLSSDGGSARWRERAAGNTQKTSSQGSVQPRLEGRVHNKVKGVEAHLVLLNTAAKKARWSRGRRLGPACCRGGRATRRRLQQVRLLFRGGDLTTDGSGLGVGVPGLGCSGFAAATHGTPSSGCLACRPDSGVVFQRRGDGLQLHRPAAQLCSSLSPLLFFPPTPSSFLFFTNSSSGMDMTPAPSDPPSPLLPSSLPLDYGAARRKTPKGLLGRGGGGFWGQNLQGGAVQGGPARWNL
jgi:hypothetical protein